MQPGQFADEWAKAEALGIFFALVFCVAWVVGGWIGKRGGRGDGGGTT